MGSLLPYKSILLTMTRVTFVVPASCTHRFGFEFGLGFGFGFGFGLGLTAKAGSTGEGVCQGPHSVLPEAYFAGLSGLLPL